ncbi:MAG: methyltransferase family protein, partial [bacterium]
LYKRRNSDLTKNLTTITAILLFYVIPLIAKPELLVHFKIVFLIVACAALLYTQPPLSLQEVNETKNADKNTVYAIILACSLPQLTAVIEWAYFREQPEHIIPTAIGIAMLVSGSAFRIWSIQTLGPFFSATVQIKEQHRIIKTGPYSIVRHPSYLGAYIAMAGGTIFLQSIFGFIIAMVAMGVAYKLRIDAEEETLTKTFGDDYLAYKMQTSKMIPFVW